MINTIFINFWPRASRTSKDILLIQVRVTVNGMRVELGSTSLKLLKSKWNQKYQRVEGSGILDDQKNYLLENIKAQIVAIYNNYETQKKYLTAGRLKELLSKDGKTIYSLSGLLDFYLLSHCDNVELTNNGYKRRFNKVFIFDANVSPNDIDVIFMNRYYTHLRNNLKYSEAYTYKCLAALKMVLDYAASQGIIEESKIQSSKLSYSRKYDTSHLTVEELSVLIKYRPTVKGNDIQTALDIYLFCCFTGLAYSDYSKFSQSQLERIKGVNFIRGVRKKTKTEYFLPLLPEAEVILKKYDYSLPILDNSTINKYIKIVIPEAGVNRRMKFHSSRKTFANYCINHLLLSKETTAKMMGQKDTKELDAYANTTDIRVLNETKGRALSLSMSGWLGRVRDLFVW